MERTREEYELLKTYFEPYVSEEERSLIEENDELLVSATSGMITAIAIINPAVEHELLTEEILEGIDKELRREGGKMGDLIVPIYKRDAKNYAEYLKVKDDESFIKRYQEYLKSPCPEMYD